jgi:hypothetical protein
MLAHGLQMLALTGSELDMTPGYVRVLPVAQPPATMAETLRGLGWTYVEDEGRWTFALRWAG